VKHIKYISLGVGVQSSYLYVGACDGIFPHADVGIFADTGDEPEYVYRQLDLLRDYGQGRIPIEVVSAGKLSDDMLGQQSKRSASVPLFTLGSDGKAAPLRRQCTDEYKILPIQRCVREMLGFKKGDRIPSDSAICSIGITIDEAHRMKPSGKKWTVNDWPLIDARLRRDDCARGLESLGFPKFSRSACVFCPYHSDQYWRLLRDNYPEEFEKALDFDARIRHQTKTDSAAFVHRSLKPLGEVKFRDEDQMDLFGEECAGMCGV